MTPRDEPPASADAPDSPWRTIASRAVYHNPWITVTESDVTRPDGAPGIYGVIDAGDNATIVALTGTGDVWMVQDFLYPIQRRAWQLPSGAIEPGEDPLEGARRELLEETGLAAARWDKLGAFYLSPGVLTQRSYLYLARDLTAGPARREGTELSMIARPVPLEQVYAACLGASEAAATNAVTALGVWLGRAWLASEATPGE